MTTPMIPDFIIDMFENEIRKVMNDALTVVAKEYNLDLQQIRRKVEKKIEMKLEIVPDTYETVKITKLKPRKIPDPESRCLARVKKDNIICQCSFQAADGAGKQFCTRHLTKMRYGTINDPPIKETRKRYTKVY